MKQRQYLVMKTAQRAFGICNPFPHEICADKKTAVARASYLNSRAQQYFYEVWPVNTYEAGDEI